MRDDQLVRLGDLVGIQELAEVFKVKENTLYKWIERYPDFPKPARRISGASVWLLPEVTHWRKARER